MINNNHINNSSAIPLNIQNGIDYLQLFYAILFRPILAAQYIKALRRSNASQLFAYAILSLIIGFTCKALAKSDLKLIFTELAIWLFSVIILGFFAWLFYPSRENTRSFDLGLLFCLTAFAQLPLVFSGIASLWSHSLLQISTFSAIIHLWVICLWGWALYNSFRLSLFRAGVLTVFLLLGPILFILLLLLITLLLLFSALLNII